MTKHSPFRYFKTSPETICLAVALGVRFPVSLSNVEDLQHKRGIEVGLTQAATVAIYNERIRRQNPPVHARADATKGQKLPWCAAFVHARNT